MGFLSPQMPKAEEEGSGNEPTCIFQHMSMKNRERFGSFVNEGEKKKERKKHKGV